MIKSKFIARQGDVLIEAVESIPSNSKKAKNNVVAVGEGHHVHEVFGDVDVLESKGELHLVVNSKGTLEHVIPGTRTKAEHNEIKLPKGNYKVIHQREYDPYEDEINRVRD